MDAVTKLAVMITLMQLAAFVLGMIFERRLEIFRKEYED